MLEEERKVHAVELQKKDDEIQRVKTLARQIETDCNGEISRLKTLRKADEAHADRDIDELRENVARLEREASERQTSHTKALQVRAAAAVSILASESGRMQGTKEAQSECERLRGVAIEEAAKERALAANRHEAETQALRTEATTYREQLEQVRTPA